MTVIVVVLLNMPVLKSLLTSLFCDCLNSLLRKTVLQAKRKICKADIRRRPLMSLEHLFFETSANVVSGKIAVEDRIT